MAILNLRRRATIRFSFALLILAGCLLTQDAQAGTASVIGETPGTTPFIGNVAASIGGRLQSVSYQIEPKAGSFTRPLTVTYVAQYLEASGDLLGNLVTVPVWGLYSNYTNTVRITFTFADATQSTQTIDIAAAAYTDPCAIVNQATFTQNRVSTTDLGFDYFIMKNTCSINDPAIVDSDGNLRWVGQSGVGTTAVGYANNTIYLSDGKSGILQMPLTTAIAAQLADFSGAPYEVTFTSHHNIDPGRNGLVVDVNTSTQLEAANLEFNPTTGAVLNFWDLGQIISYTMTQGGDDPARFVLGTSADWFHNNSTTYNPADNTLIVSSRENFVVAVDYDTPADGQKKIHWILGDTGKAWYTYPSLRALMLTPTNAATLAPIGQHAVSIDHLGNLLLFDDGLQSLIQSPAGIGRTYSAVREYQLDTKAMTATQGPIYYSANPPLFSPVCSSVYDVNNTFLVDFATVGATANNLFVPNTVVIQGLGSSENVVFDLSYLEPGPCNAGWNTYPLASNIFTFVPYGFTISAATVAIPSGSGSVYALTINDLGGFSDPVTLSVTGLPSGVRSTVYPANPTRTGGDLVLYVPTSVAAGTYPFTIRGVSGRLNSSIKVTLFVPGSRRSKRPGRPLPRNPIAARVVNGPLNVHANTNSDIPDRVRVGPDGRGGSER